jgi:amidase
MHRRDLLKWLGGAATSAALPRRVGAMPVTQSRGDNAGRFDPAFASAVDTIDAIRKKRISARELLNITLERIDRYNPKLNAIVWQFRSQSIARAALADEMLARGKSLGALHGLPVTIKEAFAYQGSPNTWGLMPLKDSRSPRTAVAVERLESAGAIVVGKTNVPLLLADYQSFNDIYGTTNNPWDVTRTPGGSTGGGAAALAAGLGCLSLGSDIGGSIRVPAHFCGVYGHKPSLELVSTAGHQPGPWDGSAGIPMDLAVMGPLARGARDLEMALRVLGGPNGPDAKAWTWRLPAPRRQQLKDFRIGYVMDDSLSPISSELGKVYDSMLSALSKQGAKLERGWPPGLDPQAQFRTYLYLLFSLLNADASREQRDELRQRLEKDPNDIFAAATVGAHSRWLAETQRRLATRDVWENYFRTHDVFLLPPAFTPAFPHDHSGEPATRALVTPEGKRPYAQDILFWICGATLAGLPATVGPVGRTTTGLPVGIQIVAPMWEDATSIEFAALMTDAVGGFTPPPGY